MTPTAEQKIRELMQEETETIGLRVFVKGGGCHGYQYGMAFESTMSEDDTVMTKLGNRLFTEISDRRAAAAPRLVLRSVLWVRRAMTPLANWAARKASSPIV